MNRSKQYSMFFTLSFWMLIIPLSFISCQEETVPPVNSKPFVRLLENQKMASTIFKVDINYAVLLPEDYNESKTYYPVVYLLHGLGTDEKSWYTDGNIQYFVDLYKNETVPMIYVMPIGYNTYYMNKYTGKYPYMDMITTELVPTIDKLFRTKNNKSARAVMGYSMGGYGALILPALNPNVFSIGVPLSMSFRNDEQYIAEPQSVFDNQWGSIFGGQGTTGQARITDYFKQHSPFHFFDISNLSTYSGMKLLIDCGDDEKTLSITNDDLHVLLRDKQIPHEYRTRNGGHSFDYWKKSYREALLFISNAVQGIPHPSEPAPVSIGALVKTEEYESIQISGVTINVLKPSDYLTSTSNYPVVYFIHDFDNDERVKKVTDVFSLYKNNITSEKLAKSIVVEIPNSENINKDVMVNIVQKIDASIRTKAVKANRIILGNSLGGLQAVTIISENSSLFGSCFLFGAKLKDEGVNPSSDVFYYLDNTDDGTNYRGYFNFYKKIRNAGIGYEYRVRQGGANYQSFLNGLSESFSSLNQKLGN